ncbi:MAG: hypothetical protein PHV74_09915 [Dehalococcoidia bacterium]|nr:hypothetical protein [Dehalococcoidia bacterium]
MNQIDFSRFQIPNHPENKVVSLKQAIAENVNPGMSLHLCVGQGTANAAICEIVRQFWGRKPDFTIYSLLLYQHSISLVYAKQVKKVISAFVGDSYPTGSPNPVTANAWLSKEIEIESWSFLSYVQRFMAGAMGLPFMPTRSLLDSSMANNKGGFMELDDPFGKGGRIGIVSPANPDLTIMHSHAADRHGNIIGTGPGGEALWGALASKNGVIATVEKIVPTEFVKQRPDLVRVPGYMVKAVAVAPYGSHPRGITNYCAPELAGYFDDFDYLIALHEAFRKEDSAREWMDKWILSCQTHEDYLDKLGGERLLYLNGRALPGSWRNEIRSVSKEHILSTSYNPKEMMVVQASREIKKRVIGNDYKLLLAGIGASNISAWLANQLLHADNHPVDLIAEFGFLGYFPPPGDPSIHNLDNLATCTMMTDSLNILGIYAGGAYRRCIGVLGAAMIDKHGNINSTMIPGKAYLIGSGGANDVVSGASEIMIVIAQAKRRLVEEAPYITGPGNTIKTLVTDIGVYEKLGEDAEFTLTKVLPTMEGATLEEQVKKARESCGWELKVSPNVSLCAPPELDSLSTIRLFDPKGYFIG